MIIGSVALLVIFVRYNVPATRSKLTRQSQASARLAGALNDTHMPLPTEGRKPLSPGPSHP